MKRFIFFVSVVGCSGGARPDPELPSEVTESMSSSTDDTIARSACPPNVVLCSARQPGDESAWFAPSAPVVTSILELGDTVLIEGEGRLLALETSALRRSVRGPSDSTMLGLVAAGEAVTAGIAAFRKGSEVREIQRERIVACADDRTARCLLQSDSGGPRKPSVQKGRRDGVGCVGIFEVRCGPPKRLVGMCWGSESCS